MGEFLHTYQDIISIENLFLAWEEFVVGKRKKKDVAEFALNLSKNIYDLHLELKDKTYIHGEYQAFKINDPKPRDIHKALVRDRLLHHAIYRILYPYFDTKFIYDSYSCRDGKGTHRALNRFRSFGHIVSRNRTRTCWVLKCDIRKFFASIDQEILMDILRKHIADTDVLWLLERVVGSFEAPARLSTDSIPTDPDGQGSARAPKCTSSSFDLGLTKGRTFPGASSLEMTLFDSSQDDKQYRRIGLPLGNLTSQLLVNIYMNEFDQWVKHELKAKHYIRYADDFVFLSENQQYLQDLLPLIEGFLWEQLRLTLHPDKVFIRTLASGVDFLGWVHFADHRVLRTSTKRRALRNAVGRDEKDPTVQSYLGLMGHGNARKLQARLQ